MQANQDGSEWWFEHQIVKVCLFYLATEMRAGRILGEGERVGLALGRELDKTIFQVSGRELDKMLPPLTLSLELVYTGNHGL